MKTARNAAVLAAVLAGVLCMAFPARAATRDFEYAKGLIDHPLEFFDLAEKLLSRMVSGSREEKAAALLGRAYLLKARGDRLGQQQAKERRKFYEGTEDGKVKGALQFVAEYEKTATSGDRLRGEALNIRSGIQQQLSRVYQDLINTLPEGDPVRKKLMTERLKMREQAVEGMRQAMLKAERKYAQALRDWRNPAKKTGDERAKSNAYREYVIATQKYVQAMLKSAASLEKGSSEQKALGKRIVTIIKGWARHQDQKMYEAPPEGVQMVNNLFLGRAYAFAGDVDKAVREGFAKVREIDPDRFGRGGRKWAWRVLLTSMMFEATALFEKAEKTGARRDYVAARNAIGYQFGTQASGTMLGIRAMILKGRIQGRLKEHESAINELNGALEKIEQLRAQGSKNPESVHAPDLRWRALRAMSEIVLVMLQEGGRIDVSPAVLVEAGRSCYRQKKFEAAVNCFRQAVNVSKARPFKERATLGGEPTAWYYMGIAYYQLKKFLEAQLAYEGCLESFLEHKMPKAFASDPKNKAVIKSIKEDILIRCAGNGRIAASRERAMNQSEFNKARFLKWIDWEIELDEEKRKDKPYYYAVAIMDSADQMAADAKRLARKSPQAGRTKRTEALENYKKAREQFLALPRASTFYEEGVYLVGVCSYQSMSVLSHKDRTVAEKKEAEDLAKAALEQFDVYEAYVRKNPPRARSEKPSGRRGELAAIKRRRKSHLSAIALYRPFIHFDLGDYDKALESAEKLKSVKLDGSQERQLHRILFKCYVEIAGRQMSVDKIESYLEKAQGEANWFNALAARTKDKDAREALENSYDYYVNTLATANGAAMNKVLRHHEKMGLTTATRQVAYDGFKKTRAQLVKALTSKEKYKTIDGLGLVAKLFIELENYAEACAAYEELLNKFDPPPNDDRMGKKDSDLIGFDKLRDRRALLNTPSIDGQVPEDMARARRAVDAIKLAMQGRPKGKDRKGRPLREIPRDYDRAVRLIEAFLQDYPKYDSKKGGKPGPARKGLEEIKEELLFRLKLLRAANGKTTCRVKLGEKLLADGREKEAKEEFAKGLESAEDALKYWPKDADVRYNKAICLLHAAGEGKLKEAREGFDNLRAGSRYGGEIFWKATRGAVRARIALGEYDGVRTILGMLMQTDADGVKRGWPDILEYIDKVAKKKGMDRKTFLGDVKVDIDKFDYRPKSAVEQMVDSKIKLVVPGYVKEGKITEDVAKVRIELLRELVEIYKKRREALKLCEDSPLDLAHKLSNGHIRSLKKIGGQSRGAENDKLGPVLKSELKKKPGEEKAKESSDAGKLVPAMGGTC